MYVLKTNLAKKANYGARRSVKNIKYLVFHSTSNDGDTDESNAKYFANNTPVASAHAFVDDDSVTVSVQADYVAYAVGGKKWTDCNKTGGGKLYGKATNSNSYSIEMCDTVRNGKLDFTEATLENAIEYGKQIMKAYNIPIERVIRHFDVNGKHCPAQWFGNDAAWNEFKKRLGDNAPYAASKGIDYSLVFNAKYYADKYADLKTAFGYDEAKLLNHFIGFGMKEHRQAKATFNPVAYRNRYVDLQKAFGVDWTAYYLHYIQHGYSENRKA